MYFFFHLITGLILGLLISDFVKDQRWLIPCASGAVLPDLIDKPIGYLLFPTTIGFGRIYSHTLFIAILVLAAGLAIWKVKKDPGLMAVGVGIFSHQVLDVMWLQPQNWYFPFLGPFKGAGMSDYFFVMTMRELKNPLEMILAILFGAAILIMIYGIKIPHSVSRTSRVVSIMATAGALLLCIFSGILIGQGISHQVFSELGWVKPEELIIGGIVIALGAGLIWRWQKNVFEASK
jgi:hypothetical protein